MKLFNLPDVGEGLQEAEIVKWNVAVGDEVTTDQIILIIETDKANVEIPSPYNGKIKRLIGEPGEIVKVGAPLVEFEVADEFESVNEDSGTVVGKLETGAELLEGNDHPVIPRFYKQEVRVRATPSVRALATKLGVDIRTVVPSGPKDSVTKLDVEKAAGSTQTNPPPIFKSQVTSQSNRSQFSGVPLKGAKRSMALNMAKARQEIALATLMDDADITAWQADEDLTVRLVGAIVTACKAEPALNAHYDHKTLSTQQFAEVNLGIAVDTIEGLYVPVLKNAEAVKSEKIREIINQFKIKARAKDFGQDELQGATLILSNFGGIGGRYATPVVVPPMVSIVGVGRTQSEIGLQDGKPVKLNKLPISLSFDHRAVTGGEAARFMSTMITELQA